MYQHKISTKYVKEFLRNHQKNEVYFLRFLIE